MALNSKVPHGPLKDKWTDYKNQINLVNPANKRHIDVIVVRLWNELFEENLDMQMI